MGYATIAEVEEVLAQALTSATPYSGGERINIINIGNDRDPNAVPSSVVNQFIVFADSHIDGILSQMYHVPLKECANGEWRTDADIDEYSSQILLSEASNLTRGQKIVIRDDGTGEEEIHYVNQVLDPYTITTVSDITTNFTGSDVRVVRVVYPHPVNQVSARFAASYIYDKYFSAQNSPNVSEYGQAQRSIAIGQINDILNGRTKLNCQRRIGERFANPYLTERYTLGPNYWDDTASERDMSKPG